MKREKLREREGRDRQVEGETERKRERERHTCRGRTIERERRYKWLIVSGTDEPRCYEKNACSDKIFKCQDMHTDVTCVYTVLWGSRGVRMNGQPLEIYFYLKKRETREKAISRSPSEVVFFRPLLLPFVTGSFFVACRLWFSRMKGKKDSLSLNLDLCLYLSHSLRQSLSLSLPPRMVLEADE